MSGRRRSKRRPPRGRRCDASVGVDHSSKAPRVLRCPNEATVELLGYTPVGETWVCEGCAEKIEARAQEASDD